MTQERFFELVYAWKDGDLTGDELYKRVFVSSDDNRQRVSQQCELLRFIEVIRDIADMELHHWTNEQVVEYCIKKLN